MKIKYIYIYICRALESWGLCGLLTLASFFVRDRSQADPFAKSLSETAFQGGGGRALINMARPDIAGWGKVIQRHSQ